MGESLPGDRGQAETRGDDATYVMRAPCSKCGCPEGVIRERGFQDVVYCRGCGAYCYCAPKSETGKPQRHIKTRDVIPPKQRARILIVRANGRCEICGASHSGNEPLHVGHLISIKNGRKMGLSEEDLNSDENLAAMCAACNAGLGTDTVPLRLMVRILMTRTRLLKEKGF